MFFLGRLNQEGEMDWVCRMHEKDKNYFARSLEVMMLG